MGKVVVKIEISNNKDILKAEENIIAAKEIRSITLETVLVDTGATTLCLPKKYIEQLEKIDHIIIPFKNHLFSVLFKI